MYRFFEDISARNGDYIYLSNKNSHHLFKVLRVEEDEKFEIVIDGNIFMVLADMEEIGKCKIIGEHKDTDMKVYIHLYQGLPKSDKLELIIQKTCELGVSEITPFNSSRTVVKWDKKKEDKKLSRYVEIAESASKQSKRTLIPKINPSASFDEMCSKIEGEMTILAYENDGQSLKKTLNTEYKKINLIIGPEGGFSEEEVKKLKKHNAKVVNLGRRILRTETAAIVLTALIQYEIGDLDEKV